MSWAGLSALIAGGLCAAACGAAPDAVPRPANETGPRAAVRAMIEAVTVGDPKALRDTMFFADKDAENRAMVLLNQVISEQRFYQALARAFPKEGGAADLADNKDLLDFEAALSKAQVKIDGDSAQITSDRGWTYFLVKKDGNWRIDFDKTQSAMGKLPGKEKLQALEKQTEALDELTAGITAGTVTTAEQAVNRLGQISDMVPDPIIEPPGAPAESRPAAPAPADHP